MKTFTQTINRFSRARVMVIGDLILDEYIWGDVERISPEAPVPVVWAKKRTFVPGGAANVANNLRSLGADVSLVGVVGKDHNRDVMLAKLREKRIGASGIIAESGRHTTLKSRIIARHQQMVRVDWEHTEPLKEQTMEKLIAFICKHMRYVDAVIIEDYGKGLFTPPLLARVISHARQLKKIVTVDPKEDNFEYYYGVTAITPNRKEAENAIRYLKMQDKTNGFKIYKDKLQTEADIRRAGEVVRRHLGLESLLITLGDQGMWVFSQDDQDCHIPTVAQDVFDVSGAGDTTIAVYTLALASGASALQAAHLANFAAGIVVGKVGTATTDRKELLARLRSASGR
ncbi:MAG TPA: D-glycero-beta-D-manno-heptose-7-phosphate kinase [Candidatus Omnitrophota bacterium]|nr:D-glycero-beta-D-manno-heptose-7-phosphate kinase [Candidatus Omnitrophota bacterium]HRZ15602.1 D-glycero-beta-D-manno-heptose-7-phosphate kinase [Candidatus Omnitrophota bacterium]